MVSANVSDSGHSRRKVNAVSLVVIICRSSSAIKKYSNSVNAGNSANDDPLPHIYSADVAES